MPTESLQLLTQESEPILDKPSSAKEKALQEVEKTLPAISAPETALPAIKFALFNFFIVNPDVNAENYSELLGREITKLSALAAKEEKYKNNDKIPPIGIELEFPIEGLDDSNIDIDKLHQIGINNGPEANHSDLWELRSSPSFSATTQSRIIEEARKSNIIGSKENLSLHINLGVPNDIEEKTRDTIYSTSSTNAFVNSGTLAFTTVARLESRKTQGVYTVKDTSIENVGRNNTFRLELRTHEFEDYKTYRAMNEVQLVAAAYFEYIRNFNQKNTNHKLIEAWNKLNRSYKDICEKNKLPNDELDAFDTDYKATIEILKKHPEIQSEMRLIYSECAREVKEVLFPNQDLELE